jgi:hypothetical protein
MQSVRLGLPGREQIALRRPNTKQSYGITDYLFWLMMLSISMPNVLELWGIDTIFKPYRVASLILACLAVPIVMREPHRSRRLSAPLFGALLYVLFVTLLFGGQYAYEQMPLLATCLALFFATYGATSRKSLLIGLYGSLISFVLTGGYGALHFAQGDYRFKGLFDNPNTFGYAGCFALLLAMNRYFPMTKWLRLFLVLGTIPILVLTGSRGTILSMFGTVMSQCWRNPRLFQMLAMISIFAAAGGLFFGDQISAMVERSGLLHRAVFDRYSREVVMRGGAGRLSIIRAGMTVGWESGFVGIGLGQYRLRHHTRFFQQRGLDGQISRLDIHNVYVSLLTEWGLVGFLCFAVMITRLLRASKLLNFEKDWIYGFCGASFFNGIGNNLLSEVHFWVMLGICVQLIRFADEVDQRRGRSEHHAL